MGAPPTAIDSEALPGLASVYEGSAPWGRLERLLGGEPMPLGPLLDAAADVIETLSTDRARRIENAAWQCHYAITDLAAMLGFDTAEGKRLMALRSELFARGSTTPLVELYESADWATQDMDAYHDAIAAAARVMEMCEPMPSTTRGSCDMTIARTGTSYSLQCAICRREIPSDLRDPQTRTITFCEKCAPQSHVTIDSGTGDLSTEAEALGADLEATARTCRKSMLALADQLWAKGDKVKAGLLRRNADDWFGPDAVAPLFVLRR